MLNSKVGFLMLLLSPTPVAVFSTGFADVSSTLPTGLSVAGIGVLLLQLFAPKLSRIILSLINLFIIIGAIVLVDMAFSMAGFDLFDALLTVGDLVLPNGLMEIIGSYSVIVTMSIVIALVGPFITIKRLPYRFLPCTMLK
jgi:hypothetical protein